jgi:Carboxypeptidase regulatory-like domain/TonB dependent receptor
VILHRYCLLFRVIRLRIILLGGLVASLAHAQQQPAATLTGQVTDPSNALITTATVTLQSSDTGDGRSATTTRNGRYTVSARPGPNYIVTVNAPGFATFASPPLRLSADKPNVLDVRLKVADLNEQISVSDENGLDTDPNHNGDSLTLKGKSIDSLPLDSAELLQQLQALAGGPSPDLYVDGFSGGTLPARDTIREIRINQNPYSAQYDTTPGNGRIEVFTKPGSNKLHGDFYTFGNASALNSRNPFSTNEPSYYSYANYASLNGAIDKHTSFAISGGRQAGQDNAIINAQTLDSGNNQIFLHQALSAPTAAYNFSTRLDAALGARNTMVARYSVAHSMQLNGGISQLSLATQGFSGSTTNQVLQLSNSTVLSPKILNDTRFQYTRARDRQIPNSSAPTVAVAGAFTGGGNSGANYNDNQDRFELQNYVSLSRGKQFFTFGGRFRSTRDANHSLANYNGTYTFASLALNPSCAPLTSCNSYQVTEQELALPVTNPVLTFAAIQALGGGPSQFSITHGNPNVAVTVADAGLFVQDDWKARANFTLSGGLRFETQNHIADHADWAPRMGFAWTLGAKKGKPANYTVRGGAGIFYHRFASGNILQAIRQNGVTQQQLIVTQPQFFHPDSPPTATDLASAQTQSTTYQISPTFHAPYYIATTLSVERRIGSLGSVTTSWVTNRGDHTQFTRNINAPLPGTYNPAVPASGTRPFGGTQNIYEYDSEGVSRVNRLSTNLNLRFRERWAVYGYYQLLSQRSDANETFASNSYDIRADFGRSSNDIRQQGTIAGSAEFPLGLQIFSFVRLQSGSPFNITVGQDLNGDSIFNDRPAFATDLSRPSVVTTRFGNFDTNPATGQTVIPINYGTGPILFAVNFDLNKTIQFGPEIKPGPGTPSPKPAPGQKPHIDRRFSLAIGIDAQNLFNRVNAAPPIGTLNSPLFGKSIALANQSASANRIIEISTFLRF